MDGTQEWKHKLWMNVYVAAQQRIAHTATHQIQVMTRRREHLAQVYEQTRMLVQRDRGSGQQS